MTRRWRPRPTPAAVPRTRTGQSRRPPPSSPNTSTSNRNRLSWILPSRKRLRWTTRHHRHRRIPSLHRCHLRGRSSPEMESSGRFPRELSGCNRPLSLPTLWPQPSFPPCHLRRRQPYCISKPLGATWSSWVSWRTLFPLGRFPPTRLPSSTNPLFLRPRPFPRHHNSVPLRTETVASTETKNLVQVNMAEDKRMRELLPILE